MNGPLLREPYSKPLENGIFELRTKQGSDITRVLYFFVIGKKAILTNGFIKNLRKLLLMPPFLFAANGMPFFSCERLYFCKLQTAFRFRYRCNRGNTAKTGLPAAFPADAKV